MPTLDDKTLRDRYEDIALSGDHRTTAADHQLRELEIRLALEHMRDGDRVLDVGCGLGYALQQYAENRKVQAFGIDYAENMIAEARKRIDVLSRPLEIDLRQASVIDLPFPEGHFDVVTSHRCLMALLDWEKQRQALREIHRVLRPGGVLVLLEGTFDGLERLNFYRRRFKLPEIAADGRDRLITLKFREKELLEFTNPLFESVRVQRFGMYYFLTRIVQPLLVAPETPSYDHRLNHVARQIAELVPDLEGMGHLVGFVLRKRP